MQSLVTNPKALQALVKIQQGVDMLQSESPNLVSRSNLHLCLLSLNLVAHRRLFMAYSCCELIATWC